MKKFFMPIIALVLLYGCSKKTDNTPPVQKPAKKLRLEKVIFALDRDPQMVYDTMFYKYDDKDRVISKKASMVNFNNLWTYTNDRLSAIYTVKGQDTIQQMNAIHYSADGDSIVLDVSAPGWMGQGTDTAFTTVLSANGKLSEIRNYFHDFSAPVDIINFKFTYNQLGNLTSWVRELLNDPRNEVYEVLSWDDKINPLYGQPVLNFQFINAGLPLASGSLHNPTSYRDKDGTVYSIAMTYNSQGYPTSIKMSNENFVGVHLIYNE